MKLYRRKDRIVAAIRYSVNADNRYDVVAWVQAKGGHARALLLQSSARDVPLLGIAQPLGEGYASPGDYVLHSGSGEFEICKPDVFEALYEPA